MDGVTATAQMTAEEFLALPDEEALRRRQLVEGDLVVCSPAWRHNHAQRSILVAPLPEFSLAVSEIFQLD